MSGVRRRDIDGVDGLVRKQRRQVLHRTRRRLAGTGPVRNELRGGPRSVPQYAAQVRAGQSKDRIGKPVCDSAGTNDRPREGY